MHYFENMEHRDYIFGFQHAACGQIDIVDTPSMSENTIFAWEADTLAGTIFITDVDTGVGRELLIESVIKNIHSDDLKALRSNLSYITSYEQRHISLKIRYLNNGESRSLNIKGMAFMRDDKVMAIGIAYGDVMPNDQIKRLEYLEKHDALTGLYNTSAFNSFVEEFFKFGMYPQTLIVAKIDRFSDINIAFGYNSGNMLIKNVAEVIKECFFDAEMLARIGGGEYCIVYAGKSRLEVDNKIKQARMMLHGMYMNLVKTDVSFGCSAAEEASGFCDMYCQALNHLRKSNAIRTMLTESTVIDSMNSIIESKAGWGKRQIRLQSLSSQVAAKLDCGEECVDVVKVLAKIADIGLVGVSDQLIKNRLKLSKNDRDKYMQHVEYGRDIICKVSELKDLQELYLGIFQPYKQQRDDIPLPSRIIAGVRGFDDIVSSGTVSFDDIAERFIMKREKEYCPTVVDAIVEVAGKHYALR